MPQPLSHPLAPLSRSARAAFTLIELLVVVGILAILGGIVIVAYDGVGDRAGDDLTRQRMAALREALLRFRADMGYFPGEGPLAATALNYDPVQIRSFDYVDGDTPLVQIPALDVRQSWADHPMNFWQLLEKPVDLTNATRWKWNVDSKRGWNGPYLNPGFHFRLDDAGPAPTFRSVPPLNRFNRLLAVADAFARRYETGDPYLRWVSNAGDLPKSYLSEYGRPLILERDPPSPTFPAVFTLVSMGPDGLLGNDDDLRLEVGREGN